MRKIVIFLCLKVLNSDVFPHYFCCIRLHVILIENTQFSWFKRYRCEFDPSINVRLRVQSPFNIIYKSFYCSRFLDKHKGVLISSGDIRIIIPPHNRLNLNTNQFRWKLMFQSLNRRIVLRIRFILMRIRP